MTGSGINFNDTYWDNVPLTDQDGKPIQKLDMASFVYYLFRCAQVHGKEIETKYKLLPRSQNSQLYYHIADDRLHIPETLIWGLLSICVFCKSNNDIKTNTDHFLTLGNNKFCISDWWGLEDSVRPIVEKHNPIRVTLQGLAFSKNTLDVIDQADDR